MKRRFSNEVRIHLEKARESAILAVDIYNKPATKFRSGGYIVLMCIAWTSLFHAIFFDRKEKPFYKKKNNKRVYERIDDDYKAWELATCLTKYYAGNDPPEKKNVEFFIGLRNKIEHRSMSGLDVEIFSECQAFLFNFEDLLYKKFGSDYAVNESLSLALQFSQLRNPEQYQAIIKQHRPLTKDVKNYIDTFRSGLSQEQFQDLRFSYKFIFLEVAGNNKGDHPEIQFSRLDLSNPDHLENYHKISLMSKPAYKEVANADKFKPNAICAEIESYFRDIGRPIKFNASSHHARATFYYKVKPKKGIGSPTDTQSKYCIYDMANNAYLYTTAWKKFLIEELKKPDQLTIIMAHKN